MTPLLFDTHILIWLMEGNARLPAEVRKQIDRASANEAALVSAITPWEIALLVAKKRVHLQMDVQQWIDSALTLPGIRLEPLSPAIAIASTRLPWQMHGDPADRILVATARHLGATLVTADEQLLRSGAEGNLRVLAAG